MKSIVPAALIFFVVGCAVSVPPYSQSREIASVDQAYQCAMTQLASLNYNVSNTDRTSGFIKAEKNTTGGVKVWGATLRDTITVVAFAGPSGAASLKITGATTVIGRGEKAVKPRPELQNDVDAVTLACGR